MKKMLKKVVGISISYMPSVLIICALLCFIVGLFVITWINFLLGFKLLATAFELIIMAFIVDFLGGKSNGEEQK